MMRKALLSILLVLTMFTTPAIAADEVSDFRLASGLKVILLQQPGNPLTTLKAIFPGTSLRQSSTDAGIESMLLAGMKKGSAAYSKEAMQAEMERYAASISYGIDKDYSTFGMQAARPFFENVLKVFADSLQNPSLPENEIELIRERTLAGIRSKLDDPDDLTVDAINNVFYQNHPYHADVEGTLESVAAINIDALKKHHAHLMESANAFLVLAGDFTLEEAKTLLGDKFNGLKPSSVISLKLVDFTPSAGQLVEVQRAQPTKYILSKFAGPPVGSEHYAALKIGMRHLSRKLWDEVRTKHALSYAVYCNLGTSLTNYGYFYLTTTNESKALPLIIAEIEKMKTETINQKELDDTRAVFTTQYYQALESTSGQAGQLALAEIYYGDYKKRGELMRQINEVTPEDIRKASEVYLKNFTFAVVGDVSNLDKAAFGVKAKTEVDESNKSTEVPALQQGE